MVVLAVKNLDGVTHRCYLVVGNVIVAPWGEPYNDVVKVSQHALDFVKGTPIIIKVVGYSVVEKLKAATRLLGTEIA